MKWLLGLILVLSQVATAAPCSEFLDPQSKADMLINAAHLALEDQLIKPEQLLKLAEPIELLRFLSAQPNEYATLELKSLMIGLIENASAAELFEMSKKLKELAAKVNQQQHEIAVAHQDTTSILNPKILKIKELNRLSRDFYFYYLDDNGLPYFISRTRMSSMTAGLQMGMLGSGIGGGGGTPHLPGKIDINHLKEVSGVAAVLRDPPLPYTLNTLDSENVIFLGSEDLNAVPLAVAENESLKLWATTDQTNAYVLDLKNPTSSPLQISVEEWKLKLKSLAAPASKPTSEYQLEFIKAAKGPGDIFVYKTSDPQSRLKFSWRDYQPVPGSAQLIKNSEGDDYLTFLTADSKLVVYDFQSKNVGQFELDLDGQTLFAGTSHHITKEGRTVLYYLDRSGLYVSINLFE